MLIDDTARFELHEALREEIGERNADTLMSMLPPVGWADVATKQDLEHLRSDFEHLRIATKADLENFRTSVQADLAHLEASLHQALNRQTWSFVSGGIAIAAILTANNLF